MINDFNSGSSAPEALARALTDPTFGTRITATRAAHVGAA
jgi:hypothetical protein